MTMKQVRFVKADSRNPVQDIAELAVFDEDGTPLDPPTSGGGTIGDSSVTTNKLANNAVTEAKIASNAVTTNKLANNAVTEAKIADGVVPTNKLANNAVTEAKIASNAVTTAKIADDAVTAAKIADGVLPTNATKEKAGLVKQAAHVDGASGSVQDIVNALVTAGIMASA